MAKFDWVPYLEGKYLSYYQWFALLASVGMLAFSFISFFVYLILNKLLRAHVRSYLYTTKQIAFYSGFFFLSMIPVICEALDVTPLLEGMMGMMAILTLGIYIDNGRQKWYRNDSGFSQSIFSTYSTTNIRQFTRLALQLTPSYNKLIKIAAIVSVAIPCFMYKTCLCFYNDQIGYYNKKLGFGINTYITRYFQLPASCPLGAPCQVYTTVPQNPAQAFFINIHTHPSVGEVTVYYQQLQTSDPTYFNTVVADSFDYYGLQQKARRKVHSALILGLKPNTKYLTKIYYDNQFWTNGIYKTLPNDPSVPVRMINAGDSGYTRAAVNLSKIAATLKPDIFFMGGDIAYDDNMPACAYTWDFFLGMYGQLTTTLGYMMPIVVSVGNHDVGLNQLPGINITINNYGPAFFIYFPQHYDRNADGIIIKRVPPISHRRSYFSFTFSNINFLALDSGYLQTFNGQQKDFMIDEYSKNMNRIKFANYHVPIYSVCEGIDRNPQRYLFALFHWVPTFDKFKVMTVFENHVHSFKRTKPLVGNSPQQNGTVYLGDGAYGAVIQQNCEPDITLNIFKSFLKQNNMWLSIVGQKDVKHYAYDSHGNVVDQFSQQVSAYVPQQPQSTIQTQTHYQKTEAVVQ